ESAGGTGCCDRRARPQPASRRSCFGTGRQAPGQHAAHRSRRGAHKKDARMTIAYFDCFAGISGDMTLGALLDCGADRALLDAVVESLRLGDEVTIEVRREARGHAAGTRAPAGVRDRGPRTGPARREPGDEADGPHAATTRRRR